jgi:hypothetical protein
MDDRAVEVSYRAGQLDGDADAVRAVTELLDHRSSLRMDAAQDDHPASLDDPYAVMSAIQEVVAIDEVEGDYPIPEADDSAG